VTEYAGPVSSGEQDARFVQERAAVRPYGSAMFGITTTEAGIRLAGSAR